ncbi:MAG: phospholipase D family protein [Caldisphaeraceae archaeon]|nr:phospholipase D family protein [Desulfurococcales archaeon]MEB3797195.1 phospholipase D family protein [Caldisphaeraceae archaeon]
MTSQTDNELTKQIKESLNKIASKLHEKIAEVYSRRKFSAARKISDLSSQVFRALEEISKKEEHINEFLKLIRKTKATPEELLNLLSLPEIPVSQSSGRSIVEGIVGYRGLGIETIDHHISRITYENVKEETEEGPITDMSITSFIYRVPPFELTRCPYERGKDADITQVLGARHVWLVKPSNISEDSWRNIQDKVIGGRRKDVIVGSYEKVGSVLQLNALKLTDITQKSLEIEIERPAFFLKLGSRRLEEELAGTNNRDRIISELRLKEQQAVKDLGWKLSSWRIRLDYVYFCYKGLAISTDPYDLECPYKNCPLRKGGLCDGKRYWSATYNKRKPYPKIYPLRFVALEYGGVPTYEEKIPKNIVSFSSYDKRRVESVWYGVEIGTWFLRARPTIRIYFDRNARIGYSIPTSLLELSFSMDWLNNEIKKILEDNDEIRKSISLKYVLYKSLKRTLDYGRLTKTINNILQGREEAEIFQKYYGEKVFDDDFLTFARRLLLHSAEHMLSQYILFKLVGVDYNFIMTRYYYRNSAKIFIIENARNGRLGIIDTVVKSVEKEGLPAFLLEFVDWLQTFLHEHDREFTRVSTERSKRATKLISETIKKLEKTDKDKANRLKKIDEIVKNFVNELKKVNIQLDITLARTVLLVSNRITEDLIEDLEDYFDDILEKHGFPLCWDGCNACVRLEKYCGEGILQVLTTSKMLLEAFDERLRTLIVTGISESSREVGKIIEPIVRGAMKSINVSSPFISPRYARMLINKSRGGVKIRVLTWMPEVREEIDEHKYHIESLRILKNNMNENLEVKIADKLHAKMYIIDEKLAITGSANLTERGMYGNYEHIDIKMDPKSVLEINNEFNKLWESARDSMKNNT